MAFISVIVPIYNAEKTLEKCISSILQQTFSDFELLLINDGSTDKSPSICKQYSNIDTRIKAIFQKNKGVSATRNKGIEESKGRFICFIDADDWIEPFYLSAFVERQKQYPDDILTIQSFYNEDGNTTRLHQWHDKYYDSSEMTKCFLENELVVYGAPWNKFYSARLIKEKRIRFSEDLSYGEDMLFLLDYWKHLKGVQMLSEATYHYVESHSVLSKKRHQPELLFQYYSACFSYIEEQMFAELPARDPLYSRVYSSQMQGISTQILNLFYFQRSFEERKLYYTKILQRYADKFPLFVGLSPFEEIKRRCLQTGNIQLIDNLFHFIFFIRRYGKKQKL